MSSRERILAAIRATLSGPPATPEAVAAEAAGLLQAPDASRPALVASSLAEAFALKAAALGTTVEAVSGMNAVPGAVRRYLDGHGLPAEIALQPAPALTGLDWTGVRTRPQAGPAEAAAVGLALWGIAESGSVVIHSGPDAPILLSFLPLHHVVVLDQATLLPHLEDYADRLGRGAIPRNAILITGPSGTTDIEGSYVRGAHGPGFLHVILVSAGSGRSAV